MIEHFKKFLLDKMALNTDVILVTCNDVDIFAECSNKYPTRIFNLEEYEQGALAFSSGLAEGGKKSFVYGSCVSFIEGAFSQIKYIDINSSNVVLIGYFSDLYYQDVMITVMSLFKNIIVSFPQTNDELSQALNWSYRFKSPSFIAIRRDKNVN